MREIRPVGQDQDRDAHSPVGVSIRYWWISPSNVMKTRLLAICVSIEGVEGSRQSGSLV